MVLINESKESDRTELKSAKSLSLNNYAEMKFRGVLENIPTTDNSSKRGILIDQIHNRYMEAKEPLIRVYTT